MLAVHEILVSAAASTVLRQRRLRAWEGRKCNNVGSQDANVAQSTGEDEANRYLDPTHYPTYRGYSADRL